jgi:TRAP-type C4-dicarboxylate transport system substrate-binding protein
MAAMALTLPTSEASGPYELNIGSLAPEGTPWADLLSRVEKQVEADSAGQINVIIRPPGLMAEVEMVRETRSGERLQASAVTTAALAEGGNLPILQLVELPFLFDNNNEADSILDNVLWNPLSEILGRRGFILGVWSENGWRSMATKGKAARLPADLQGLKMRAQESDVHMAMYRTYGAQAVQKPMTEVLTALQSNVVDGLDNTALYILTAGLADPVDYYTLTRHIYQPAVIVYSKRWFSQLPENLQEILRKPRSLATEGRAAIRAEDAAMLELFPMSGVEVIELTDEERNAWRDQARAMHSEFAADIEGAPELLATIQQALDKMRAE